MAGQTFDDSMSLTLWLARGWTAGAIFAIVENVFAIVSGHNLPLWYLLSVVALDILGGLLLGACVFALGQAMPRLDDSLAGRFLPLACGLTILFHWPKAAAIAGLRGISGTLAVSVLVGIVIVATLFGARLLTALLKAPPSETSLAVTLLGFAAFLVSGNYVAWTLYDSYTARGSVLSIAVLGVSFMLAVVLLDRSVFRHLPRALPMSTIAASTTAATFIATFVLWYALAPPKLTVTTVTDRGVDGHDKPPVILISIDTLRADRLSIYGNSSKTTPVLDELAKESLVFKNAISPSTWTVPGHASMLTGTFASKHSAHYIDRAETQDGWIPSNSHAGNVRPLLPDNVTLAEILSEHGYRTAGVIANSGYLHRTFGFDQGFDFYHDQTRRYFGYRPVFDAIFEKLRPLSYYYFTKTSHPANEINDIAFEWLDRNHESPFFLFLNYVEPHGPYCAPAPFNTKFLGQDFNLAEMCFDSIAARYRKCSSMFPLYDGEIAFVDQQIGRLFEKLEELGVFDESLIVVTSDHGEFLGEHELFGHGIGPFEEVHRVPLIIKYPHAKHTGSIDTFVQTVDIVPTVLDGTEIPAPDYLDGDPVLAVDHPIITEQYRSDAGQGYRAIYEHPWKLVMFDDGSVRLYDLGNDLSEKDDVADDHRDVAQNLQLKLESFVATSLPIAGVSERELELDEAMRRKLRALGYIQ